MSKLREGHDTRDRTGRDWPDTASGTATRHGITRHRHVPQTTSHMYTDWMTGEGNNKENDKQNGVIGTAPLSTGAWRFRVHGFCFTTPYGVHFCIFLLGTLANMHFNHCSNDLEEAAGGCVSQAAGTSKCQSDDVGRQHMGVTRMQSDKTVARLL